MPSTLARLAAGTTIASTTNEAHSSSFHSVKASRSSWAAHSNEITAPCVTMPRFFWGVRDASRLTAARNRSSASRADSLPNTGLSTSVKIGAFISACVRQPLWEAPGGRSRARRPRRTSAARVPRRRSRRSGTPSARRSSPGETGGTGVDALSSARPDPRRPDSVSTLVVEPRRRAPSGRASPERAGGTRRHSWPKPSPPLTHSIRFTTGPATKVRREPRGHPRIATPRSDAFMPAGYTQAHRVARDVQRTDVRRAIVTASTTVTFATATSPAVPCVSRGSGNPIGSREPSRAIAANPSCSPPTPR